MALDVYVGPLTRYYTGRWKPIIPQLVEGFDPSCGIIQGGLLRIADNRVTTPEGETRVVEAKTDRKYIPSATAGQEIEKWRLALNQALAARLQKPLGWHEDKDGVYFTDKPGWDAYIALALWAAHEEHPEFEVPAVAPRNLKDDPALRLSENEEAASRYPTLLRSNFWLPAEYSFTFKGRAPNEGDVTFGFSPALVKELGELNARTWSADEATLSEWLARATRREDALEPSAKFGFAVFYTMARKAVEHNLPMLLDW